MIELCIDNSTAEANEDYESLTEIKRIKCENLSYFEFFQVKFSFGDAILKIHQTSSNSNFTCRFT